MFFQAEKDLAKARMDIAHEVRLAKEAEAAMDLHVTKAGERAEKEIEKHTSTGQAASMETANGPIYTATETHRMDHH